MSDLESSSYKEKLDLELNELICNEWGFLNENWKLILNKYNHRTKLEDIENNNMQAVKDVLLNTLGYIAVFYFLNELYGNQEYPAPYKKIDKGLLILYHMVSGLSPCYYYPSLI